MAATASRWWTTPTSRCGWRSTSRTLARAAPPPRPVCSCTWRRAGTSTGRAASPRRSRADRPTAPRWRSTAGATRGWVRSASHGHRDGGIGLDYNWSQRDGDTVSSQSNTFTDMSMSGGDYGMAIGWGQAMCSETTWFQCYISGRTGVLINNYNALQHAFISGNIAGCQRVRHSRQEPERRRPSSTSASRITRVRPVPALPAPRPTSTSRTARAMPTPSSAVAPSRPTS